MTLVTPRVSQRVAAGVSLHVRLPGVALPMYPELQAARPWLGRRAERALLDFRPDVVHVATEALVGLAGRRWALKHGVPLATSYCTNFPDYLPGYGLGWARGLLWRYLRAFHSVAQITFVPSASTLDDLATRGFHRRLGIWSRGVDASLFDPRNRREDLRTEMGGGADVVLLYVGRMATEKRVDLLLDAFGRLRHELGDAVTLVLVGDGPALPRLKEQRQPGVHFTGYRRGEALAAHYASADLFVFPSDTETFGQVVTEAMASGLPVVAPDRGGVTDTVIPGHTGELFSAGDPADLARRVLELIRNPDDRRAMGRRAVRSARRRNWDEVFKRLFRQYAQLCPDRDTIVAEDSTNGFRGPAIFQARQRIPWPEVE